MSVFLFLSCSELDAQRDSLDILFGDYAAQAKANRQQGRPGNGRPIYKFVLRRHASGKWSRVIRMKIDSKCFDYSFERWDYKDGWVATRWDDLSRRQKGYCRAWHQLSDLQRAMNRAEAWRNDDLTIDDILPFD